MKRKLDTICENSLPLKKPKVLQTFNKKKYIYIAYDNHIQESLCFNQPKFAGSLLIADYYQLKYQTDIRLINVEDEDMAIELLIDEAIKSPVRTMHKNEYRIAFILHMENTHANAVIYIKKGKDEGLFFADSLGIKMMQFIDIKAIQEKMNIPAYIIKHPAQADNYSCFTNAIIFGRDCTAIDVNQFRIPDLLHYFKTHSKQNDLIFKVTKLPEILFKTAQKSTFFKAYAPNKDKTIHRDESLDKFITRYKHNVSLKNRSIDIGAPKFLSKNINLYSCKKGIRFAREIMPIQFYLNQLKSLITMDLKQVQNFIKDAKAILLTFSTDTERNEQLAKYSMNLLQTHIIRPKFIA